MANLTKLKIWGPEAESENEQKSETVNLNRIKTQDSFESKLSKLHGNSDSDSDDNADGEAEGNADKGMTKLMYGGSEEEQQQKKNKDEEETYDYNKYNTKDDTFSDLNTLNFNNADEESDDDDLENEEKTNLKLDNSEAPEVVEEEAPEVVEEEAPEVVEEEELSATDGLERGI